MDMAPLPEPLLLEIKRRGMQLRQRVIPKVQLFSNIYLVEEGVEGPGEEEADPANGHDDPHLALAQGVRVTVDVNQLHVLLHTQLCGDGQPEKDWSNNCSLITRPDGR